MYYAEKWVNGELCFRVSPSSEWTPFTLSQYKNKVLKLEQKLKRIKNIIN
jgi:hypothetical protein